jgi:hypothetical protein
MVDFIGEAKSRHLFRQFKCKKPSNYLLGLSLSSSWKGAIKEPLYFLITS